LTVDFKCPAGRIDAVNLDVHVFNCVHALDELRDISPELPAVCVSIGWCLISHNIRMPGLSQPRRRAYRYLGKKSESPLLFEKPMSKLKTGASDEGVREVDSERQPLLASNGHQVFREIVCIVSDLQRQAPSAEDGRAEFE
jgi:hypothetical protein